MPRATLVSGFARLVALMAMLHAGIGCSRTSSTDAAFVIPQSLEPSRTDVLALPFASAIETGEHGLVGWEQFRREHDLGASGSALTTIFSIAEVRHREQLRTTNGRPRNDSHTTSRSLKRVQKP